VTPGFLRGVAITGHVCNIIDICITLHLLQHYVGLQEGNPFLSDVLASSMGLAVFMKLGLGNGGIFTLHRITKKRNSPLAGYALVFMTSVLVTAVLLGLSGLLWLPAIHSQALGPELLLEALALIVGSRLG
jgi:hypothetical protein